MPNPYFQFKQFTIRQDKCAMKVGTDGVLLGAWTKAAHSKRILDVGTGTGLIAIMLAQRSNAFIDAVEIDELAYQQAVENGKACPWSDRISFFHSSFHDFIKNANQTYDLIVSNSPYHKESTKSPHVGRHLARHSENLDYSAIIESSSKLLALTGEISLIIPASEEINAQKHAGMNGMYCARITRIIPSPGKNFSRSLMEFSRQYRPLNEDIIMIEEKGRHQFSPEYIRLTKDFYLKFH